MADETIRLANGATLTGRLVAHLGGGRVEIDVDGRRYAGAKLAAELRQLRLERRPARH